MLARSSYEQEYIDACRRQVDAQVAAFTTLASSAPADTVAAFEPTYFNALVVYLEACFLHRTRAVEGKDGNPLNEVRVLTVSLTSGGGRMGTDRTMKLTPATSVLGHAPGDEIAVRRDAFVRLADAFFADLEKRFR